MKTIVPDYYNSFKCIADKCKNTCCVGWEIDIDEKSLARLKKHPEIANEIEYGETPHFKLLTGERCPFLTEKGLCSLIDIYGENILCDICRDHPRFRNYWSDRVELGLGLVCEEAARIILQKKTPMKLVEFSNDRIETQPLSDEEQYLLNLRDNLLSNITEKGALARLKEYLIYRHLPDALYDDRLQERINFINNSFNEIKEMYLKTDGSINSLVNIVIKWSYDVEYDDEEFEKRLEKAID